MDDPALDVLEAQAGLQTVIGLLKLDDPENEHLPRLQKSLAYLHRALWWLDKPMYDPSRHPDVPNPQPENAAS